MGNMYKVKCIVFAVFVAVMVFLSGCVTVADKIQLDPYVDLSQYKKVVYLDIFYDEILALAHVRYLNNQLPGILSKKGYEVVYNQELKEMAKKLAYVNFRRGIPADINESKHFKDADAVLIGSSTGCRSRTCVVVVKLKLIDRRENKAIWKFVVRTKPYSILNVAELREVRKELRDEIEKTIPAPAKQAPMMQSSAGSGEAL